jgi:hypothetical protein
MANTATMPAGARIATKHLDTKSGLLGAFDADNHVPVKEGIDSRDRSFTTL